MVPLVNAPVKGVEFVRHADGEDKGSKGVKLAGAAARRQHMAELARPMAHFGHVPPTAPLAAHVTTPPTDT